MASRDSACSGVLLEQISRLSLSGTGTGTDAVPGLLCLSDEVLLVIFGNLEPVSLLRLGSTCARFFRICSCPSLWTKLFQDSFGVILPNSATTSYTAKTSFRLVFMWRALFRNIHCNRSLQEKLFAEVPFPPHVYWTQWLVLEDRVPLPSPRLASGEVQRIWGIPKELFKEKLGEKAEDDDDEELVKFEWKELYNLALEHHGGLAVVFQHVLRRHGNNDHSELESMYHQYTQCRFQWLFTYWLFRQPAPFSRQLRSIYLQWRKHSKKKVSTWGETLCDVRYLASLHPVTSDFWRGKLARGDENVGIQTVGSYFSMCRSLAAWILGRDWGRLKRRKVYEDTLDGVYLLLKPEIQEKPIDHERFWQVAKVQMSRVCSLEEAANNYANWKMMETLPYYRLYLVSGNDVYLEQVRSFLHRKRFLHDWIYLEENTWIRELLPAELFSLLEFHTKISQGSLHGDSPGAGLGRLVWLYLHSGEQSFLWGVKETILQHVHAHLTLGPALGDPPPPAGPSAF